MLYKNKIKVKENIYTKKYLKVSLYVLVVLGISLISFSYARPFFVQNYKILEGRITSKVLQNKMGALPSNILAVKDSITEIHFVEDTRMNIREAYDDASVKADVTLIENGETQGYVMCWVENNKLYIESPGSTYLTIPNQFQDFTNATVLDTTNADFSLINPIYATNISYDNTISSINCEDFQCLVDELAEMVS